MKKTKIDRGIYATTLEFLSGRAEMYRQILDLSKSEKRKAEEGKLLEDCELIKKNFEESFMPGRKN